MAKEDDRRERRERIAKKRAILEDRKESHVFLEHLDRLEELALDFFLATPPTLQQAPTEDQPVALTTVQQATTTPLQEALIAVMSNSCLTFGFAVKAATGMDCPSPWITCPSGACVSPGEPCPPVGRAARLRRVAEEVIRAID